MRDEFESPAYPGFAWVTDGRTIENYVPHDLLADAVLAVHRGADLRYDGDKWADPLEADPERHLDKIRIAHAACSRWDATQMDHRDLRRRTAQVVTFIKNANGL